jgi:hypothetical protein
VSQKCDECEYASERAAWEAQQAERAATEAAAKVELRRQVAEWRAAAMAERAEARKAERAMQLITHTASKRASSKRKTVPRAKKLVKTLSKRKPRKQ